MFNNITELFLNVYFLIDKVAGKLADNDRLIFDKLFAAISPLETDKDALYALTQRREVREVETYADYAQICRIQKYAELADCVDSVSDETQYLITIKGNALRKVKQYGWDSLADSTRAAVCQMLSEFANKGLVAALYALGFLQCEGIYVDRDPILGKKNLEKAAQWNSIEAIFLSLHYDADRRWRNLSRLLVAADGSLNKDLFKFAEARYGPVKTCVDQECRLLQKAFGAGILKADVYAPQYARFIFSEILDIKDKERLLFSGNREAISETADMPLKLRFDEIVFDRKLLSDIPLARDEETEKIYKSIASSDMRNVDSYRPLCICSDSEIISNIYLNAISNAFGIAHVEKIDVADLSDYDLEPTKNNVFVRSCNEDKSNVYILNLKGNICEHGANAVRNFLQSGKRKKIRLRHPSAIVDLSAVLPICFCDKQNARLIRPYCDVVTLPQLNSNEKRVMIDYLLSVKAVRYHLETISADKDAVERLADYSLDTADSVIDELARHDHRNGSLTITADMLKDALKGNAGLNTKYGFGGAVNESK